MKLARFISSNLDAIVGEFETFARSLAPASFGCSVADLRDHARAILMVIVEDMGTTESSKETRDKSIGQVSEITGAETPAATHGSLRQMGGFTLPQLTAEFRALRASVLCLWMPTAKNFSKAMIDDMIRFNEAIDQALQESAIRYAQRTDRARDTFLAILGHDLRSPLATMAMAGVFLTRDNEGTERTAQIGARVKRSAATMNTMVNDLLQYARTELGGKMPISPILGDVRDICQSAVDDASATHPDCVFKLSCKGETIGDFDSPRLEQVFSNLLNNAAQYRSEKKPVTISIVGEADAVVVHVKNFGREIPPQSLRAIFDPLVQLSVSADQKGPASTSLGLGLFIAREITVAHGGTIGVESSAQAGTVFTVRLPRGSLARQVGI